MNEQTTEEVKSAEGLNDQNSNLLSSVNVQHLDWVSV